MAKHQTLRKTPFHARVDRAMARQAYSRGAKTHNPKHDMCADAQRAGKV